MAKPTFLTVPVELLEHAEAAVAVFRDRGFKVGIEPMELGFPGRPTMRCTRHGTTLIVEVRSGNLIAKAREWAHYCASRTTDTQVAMCVPAGTTLAGKVMTELQQLRVGLYSATSETLVEALAPADLALKVVLPDAGSLPVAVRRTLGPVYEQFDRKLWREGFGDATQILEERARRYLKAGIRSTRITLLKENGQAWHPTNQAIDKMTIGALATAFASIQMPSQSDSIIAASLQAINPDRINFIHKKAKATTEKKLRANVGKHMWTIVGALKEML